MPVPMVAANQLGVNWRIISRGCPALSRSGAARLKRSRRQDGNAARPIRRYRMKAGTGKNSTRSSQLRAASGGRRSGMTTTMMSRIRALIEHRPVVAEAVMGMMGYGVHQTGSLGLDDKLTIERAC